jgi:hypothetical protein
MQLMPPTAARLQVANIHDPLQNIEGGAKQLRHLLNVYHGNLRLALAAYNAGAHRVKGEVPKIRETKLYIQRVLAYYQNFRSRHKVPIEQNGKSGGDQPILFSVILTLFQPIDFVELGDHLPLVNAPQGLVLRNFTVSIEKVYLAS